MPNRQSQNLLFATYALRTQSISEEQFKAAIKAWSLDPSRSFSDVLLELEMDRSAYDSIQWLVAANLGDESKTDNSELHNHLSPELRELLRKLEGSDPAETEAQISQIAEDTLQATLIPEDESGTNRLSPAHPDDCRYEKVKYHDEGGLGMVFLAKDKELGRQVALKELKPKAANSVASQLRFVTEAEITGGLGHPGIVSVYGLGNYADGRPYYAMQFIQGENLRTKIAEFYDRAPTQTSSQNRVELRRLIRHFIDACHAVHYAHTRGVLHRDIKPGNIMVGRYGETLVVDWGLAKWASRSENSESEVLPDERPLEEGQLIPLSGSRMAETMLGTAVGTPYFMSPEQARGEEHVGPATDIYSLGGTLFVILTNRRPREDRLDVLLAAREGSITQPRRIEPRIPKPIEAICLKAMQPRPEDRYGTALELANDLEQYLADEQVSAYSESTIESFQRFFRRHRGIASTAIVALLLLGLVSIVWGTYSYRLKVEANKAEKRARASLEFLSQSLRSPNPNVQGREVTVASILETAVENSSKMDAGARSDILESIARTYKALRMPEEGTNVAELLVPLRRNEFGRMRPQL